MPVDRKDITAKIERLEATERRVGVTLGGLSAYLVRYNFDDEPKSNCVIYLCGEVFADVGTDPAGYILAYVEVLDQDEAVLAHNDVQWDAGKFMGFDTFHMEVPIPHDRIKKIRVYPDFERPKYRYSSVHDTDVKL